MPSLYIYEIRLDSFKIIVDFVHVTFEIFEIHQSLSHSIIITPITLNHFHAFKKIKVCIFLAECVLKHVAVLAKLQPYCCSTACSCMRVFTVCGMQADYTS